MNTLYLILYILAAVCFLLSAFLSVRPVTTTGRPLPNLVALGLLAWVLVPLIQTARAM
jgi:phosphotransferase system  glucose/maltose/N-acetylglucosamine-specific IIC component